MIEHTVFFVPSSISKTNAKKIPLRNFSIEFKCCVKIQYFERIKFQTLDIKLYIDSGPQFKPLSRPMAASKLSNG